MAAPGDVAILISQSGETAELEPVIDHFRRVGIPIIAITGNPASMLGEAAAAPLVLPHWPEVGPESVAPTTSTTMTLALGDALAMTVMRDKGFTRTDFGRLHPGGSLGARLKPVSRLMHGGEQVPLTGGDSSMHDAIVEMTAKRLGVVGVTDDAGRPDRRDHRRRLRAATWKKGSIITAQRVHDRQPEDHRPERPVDDALALFDEYRITTLFVVEEAKAEAAARRAPHPRLPGRPDERRHPDPGAVRLVALSGKAAGRTEGRGRRRQAADPAQPSRRRAGCAELSGVHVVTDDERIADALRGFGVGGDHDLAGMPQRHRAMRRGAGLAPRPRPGRSTSRAMRCSPRRASSKRSSRAWRPIRDALVATPAHAPARGRSARASGRGSGRARWRHQRGHRTRRARRSISRSG